MERFRLYGLAEHLTTTARRQAIGAGPEAVETADLAVGVAECLEPGAYSQGLVRDAQALAWAALGNARRVCGELEAADRALAIARDRLEHGTGEPMARADVLSLSGALRIEQRRFDEANSLLEEACSIFRDCGRPRLEGKVMINQSRSAYENGDCERSVVLLEQAESLFDPVLDRRLILFSRLNRTASLADLGWAGAAVALYRRVEPEFLEQVTERRPHARLRWVGARVAWATENREEAVAIFESLVNDFPDVISACESAIIRLELAAIRLEQGRVPEVRKLAKEILQTFAERGMDHHLRKTLDLAGKAPQA